MVTSSSTSTCFQKSKEIEQKNEDLDILDFEVVDKGVEIQDKTEAKEAISEDTTDERSSSSEVAKEAVNDQIHLTRLTELDSIARQIKAPESMMGDENPVKTEDETETQKLDAVKETPNIYPLKLEAEEEDATAESKVFMPDLGKGLGYVVQTRDEGYLATVNPFNVEVTRKETPKLAMQISKPLVLPSHKSMNGFEIFLRMAAFGIEEISSEILSAMPTDELMGKTAEQIAFKGIASAIIHGRNKM
ncbi:hypothetical protein NE237_024913 [Protea cynaroides]|uniref:PMI1/PMIR1-2 C-terminal domain-containing protein n=1 Tax=Protea cynaroides TaxID=273540 RepID=A0A9Q0H0X6_9MAGN|nr:hypothetical protein NE237_024913 [Protea cynaroides]